MHYCFNRLLGAFLLIFFIFYKNDVIGQSSIKPSDISGLQLWLRADTGLTLTGNLVDQWKDISGNSNHVFQGAALNKPLWNTSDSLLGHFPVVKFDGVNSRLESAFIKPDVFSVFVIYSHRIGNTGCLYSTSPVLGYPLQRDGAVWPNSNAANYSLSGFLNSSNLYADFYDFQNDKYNTYLNGNLAGGFTNSLPSVGGLIYIGSGPGEPLNGNIAEFLMYDTTLHDTIRVKIENYLMNKYAPPINLGSDIASAYFCDTMLSDSSYFVSYLWSTGSTAKSIQVNKTGKYWVDATDIFGRNSSDTINVTFPGNLRPFPDTTMCYRDTLIWNTGLDKTGFSFIWQDATTDSFLVITQAGQYYVSVTDTVGVTGCTSTSYTIIVSIDNFSQTASLGADVSMCSGGGISLVSGAGQATSYLWSTGETTASIIITSTGLGTYSLSVQNALGCVALDTIDVNVKGYAPAVDFYSPPVCFGYSSQFSDSTKLYSLDSIASWNWNFGDASTSSAQNPVHTYTAAGTYTVQLSVVSDSGCIAALTKTDTIHPIPIAAFTVTTPIICAGASIQFSDMSTNGLMVFWKWDFGDGTPVSNFKNPTHIYSTAGDYQVQLIVTSSFGCIDTFTFSVSVLKSCFVPSDINNLKMWFKSDSGLTLNGNLVDQWDDMSGNGNNVIQSMASKKPIWLSSDTLLNDYPVIKFDGISSKLEASYFRPNKYSVFVIYSHRTGDQGSFYGTNAVSGYPLQRNVAIWPNSNASSYSLVDSINLRNLYFDSHDFDNDNYGTFLNGVNSGGASNANSNSGGAMYIGSSSSESLNGNLAEFILFDTVLHDTSRIKVENYLMDKYAPPVKLGVDIVSSYFCDTMLVVSKYFPKYNWSTGDSSKSIRVNKSGKYWVDVVDIFGRASSDTINVSYPGNFKPFPDTTICLGDTLRWNTGLNKIGYSFLWQDASVDSVMTITQAGKYYVRASDTLGCMFFSDSITVSIDSFALKVSLGPDTAYCSGQNLSLAAGAGQAVSYLWSTGATTSSILISASATYSVIVQNALGCVAKDTVVINIKGVIPNAVFTAPPACFGNAISFTDNTTVPTPDSIATWAWNFGDASTSSAQNPVHAYAAAGSYSVILSVVSDSGCPASTQLVVNVYPVPNASFNISLFPACTKASTQFLDMSTISSGALSSWKWDFGDPSTLADTSVVKNPSYTYTAAGTYTVQLIVGSLLGCKDTMYSTVLVSPSPSFGFLVDTVCLGSATTFTDTSLGTLSNWLWNFGDGTNSTIQNPTHTYSTSGTHNVTLQVTASNGCVSTGGKNVIVNHLPKSKFVAKNICVGSPLQFTDSSTVIGSTITQWSWQFGNSSSSNLQNPTATYLSPGTYSVTLTATSAQGCSAASTQTVSAMPLPVSNFSFTPAYSYPQQPVNFSDLSVGSMVIHWSFGDGGVDSISNPVHTYQSTGTFVITLISQSSFGCLDTSFQSIVIDIPRLDMSVMNVIAGNSSGVVSVSALLKNVGTLDVTGIVLSAYLDDGTPIQEYWSGLIKPGASILYSFNSAFELVNNEHSIVCVDIKKVNGQLDDVVSNNKKCIAINNEFTLLNPFPNPTIGEINFFFITPDIGKTKAEIIDARGRVVAIPLDGKSDKGLNQIIFNTIKLEKGMYVLRLSYEGKVLTSVFVKE